MKQIAIRMALLLAALLAVPACDNVRGGLLSPSASEAVRVHLDGRDFEVGRWRFFNGVRLLECDFSITAKAHGGRSRQAAEWSSATIRAFSLRTGQHIWTDFLTMSDVRHFWGAREILSGERQRSRPIRERYFEPFRLEFNFAYRTPGRGQDHAKFVTDCL